MDSKKICNYAKKIETRSVKTKNPLVKYKTVTDINLLANRKRVSVCFYWDYAEAEKNKKKVAKFKNSPLFS